MSALQIAKTIGDVGAFDTRNESEVSRITKGAAGGADIDTRNTAEAAIAQIFESFGSDVFAPNFERYKLSLASHKGTHCYDCERELTANEPVYRFKAYRMHTYCENCKPDYWYTQGKCETCSRDTFNAEGSSRQHVFCSQLCSSRYWNKVQRDNRLKSHQKKCGECGKAFTAPRSDTKFCRAACKQKAYRTRQAAGRA